MNDNSPIPHAGGIVRGPRPSDQFAQISNAALADERLSFRARGVLAYLLSRPVGWHTTRERLADAGKEGRDAIGTALRELEACGYLVRVRAQDDRGRWYTTTYVNDAPATESPATGNPASVHPYVGGPGGNRRRTTRRNSSSPFVDDLTTRATAVR